MAAPHSSCLRESLEARGKSLFFFRSVRAMMDTREPSSFTMGSLPAGGVMEKYGLNSYFCTSRIVAVMPLHQFIYLFYFFGGFHWLPSMLLQLGQQLGPLSLS